jgi:1-hydroxycarotenoid 3,4-desaturase
MYYCHFELSFNIDTRVTNSNGISGRASDLRTGRVIVIGAGIGGLVAAVDLAARGLDVVVVEAAATPGGKMSEVDLAGRRIDVGPTVLTLRWVFEEIFAQAGAALSDHVGLRPLAILARHAWSADDRLDLFADRDRSIDAIGRFAGVAAARGYQRFCERAAGVYRTLEHSFIRQERPSLLGLVGAVGPGRFGELWRISPFESLWGALGRYFADPRLRQLFGRYATYCGSSPFLSPATLMLVAHVEQSGVWLVEGGMHRLAVALARLAQAKGARLRSATRVRRVLTSSGRASGVELACGERLDADAIVCNADVAAVAGGLLGNEIAAAAPPLHPAQRSLSALTTVLVAETRGFPLVRHNVFFSEDYAAEFDDLLNRRLPSAPTVYVCAQDRDDAGVGPGGAERLFCLVNAPATGDSHPFEAEEIAQCQERLFARLQRCGLDSSPARPASVTTTPADFHQRFPGTGGALYGRASHGWTASFRRPGNRSRVPGLYLAGGSTHPGPGVPMAALSGRHAAASLLADLASTSRFSPAAMPGGISTP